MSIYVLIVVAVYTTYVKYVVPHPMYWLPVELLQNEHLPKHWFHYIRSDLYTCIENVPLKLCSLGNNLNGAIACVVKCINMLSRKRQSYKHRILYNLPFGQLHQRNDNISKIIMIKTNKVFAVNLTFTLFDYSYNIWDCSYHGLNNYNSIVIRDILHSEEALIIRAILCGKLPIFSIFSKTDVVTLHGRFDTKYRYSIVYQVIDSGYVVPPTSYHLQDILQYTKQFSLLYFLKSQSIYHYLIVVDKLYKLDIICFIDKYVNGFITIYDGPGNKCPTLARTMVRNVTCTTFQCYLIILVKNKTYVNTYLSNYIKVNYKSIPHTMKSYRILQGGEVFDGAVFNSSSITHQAVYRLVAPIHFRIHMSVLYQRWNIPNVMDCMFGGVSVIDVLASNSTKTRITICGMDDPKMLPTIFRLTSTNRVMLVTVYHYKYYGDFNINIHFMQSSCEVIYLQASTSPYLDISENVLFTNKVSTRSLTNNDIIINISYPAESCLVGYMIPPKPYMTNHFHNNLVFYTLSNYYNGRQYANKVEIDFETHECVPEILVEDYMPHKHKNIKIHFGGTFSLSFMYFAGRFDKWAHCLYMFHAKHIECQHECKVLKMNIPGLCDICNENVGNFQSLSENGLSTKETSVARLYSHANSSISLYFDGQQCSMNELNVTMNYYLSLYRQGFSITSHWTLKSKSSIHIYSRFGSVLIVSIVRGINLRCSPILRIQKQLSHLEEAKLLSLVLKDMLPQNWLRKYNRTKNINAKFTYNIFHSEAGISWNEAEEYCSHSGGHLVSVHSTQEIEYILH